MVYKPGRQKLVAVVIRRRTDCIAALMAVGRNKGGEKEDIPKERSERYKTCNDFTEPWRLSDMALEAS